MFRVGLYARVSTNDQQTLAMQNRAMREYAARRGWSALPYLPIVFSILHLSYGLGFLVGLVKFWNRWGDKVGKTPGWTRAAIG